MRRTPTLAVLLALALLALPATSFAGGAGDDQYQEPLAGQDAGGAGRGGGGGGGGGASGGGGGSSAGNSGTSGSAGTSTPAPTASTEPQGNVMIASNSVG